MNQSELIRKVGSSMYRQVNNSIENKTVPIDCGYDTGHMEFNMERGRIW